MVQAFTDVTDCERSNIGTCTNAFISWTGNDMEDEGDEQEISSKPTPLPACKSQTLPQKANGSQQAASQPSTATLELRNAKHAAVMRGQQHVGNDNVHACAASNHAKSSFLWPSEYDVHLQRFLVQPVVMCRQVGHATISKMVVDRAYKRCQ